MKTITRHSIKYDFLPKKFVIGIPDSGKKTYCEQWAEKLNNRNNTVAKIIDSSDHEELKQFLSEEREGNVFLFVLNVTEAKKTVLGYNYPSNFNVTFTGDEYLWEYICENNFYTDCEFVQAEFSLREALRLLRENGIYDLEQSKYIYNTCGHLPSNIQRFLALREEILALPQIQEQESFDEYCYRRLAKEQFSVARLIGFKEFIKKTPKEKIDEICKHVFICPQYWWVGNKNNIIRAVLYSFALIALKKDHENFLWFSDITANEIVKFFKDEGYNNFASLKEILDALRFLNGIGYIYNVNGAYTLTPTMQNYFERQMENDAYYEYTWAKFADESIFCHINRGHAKFE